MRRAMTASMKTNMTCASTPPTASAPAFVSMRRRPSRAAIAPHFNRRDRSGGASSGSPDVVFVRFGGCGDHVMDLRADVPIVIYAEPIAGRSHAVRPLQQVALAAVGERRRDAEAMLFEELASGCVLRRRHKFSDDRLTLCVSKRKLPDMIEQGCLDRAPHRPAAQDKIVDSRFLTVETAHEHRADP